MTETLGKRLSSVPVGQAHHRPWHWCTARCRMCPGVAQLLRGSIPFTPITGSWGSSQLQMPGTAQGSWVSAVQAGSQLLFTARNLILPLLFAHSQYMQKKNPLYSQLKEETVWQMEHFNSYVNEKFRTTHGLPKDWVLTVFTVSAAGAWCAGLPHEGDRNREKTPQCPGAPKETKHRVRRH